MISEWNCRRMLGPCPDIKSHDHLLVNIQAWSVSWGCDCSGPSECHMFYSCIWEGDCKFTEHRSAAHCVDTPSLYSKCLAQWKYFIAWPVLYVYEFLHKTGEYTVLLTVNQSRASRVVKVIVDELSVHWCCKLLCCCFVLLHIFCVQLRRLSCLILSRL